MICSAHRESGDVCGPCVTDSKASQGFCICLNSMTCYRAVILTIERAVFVVSALPLINVLLWEGGSRAQASCLQGPDIRRAWSKRVTEKTPLHPKGFWGGHLVVSMGVREERLPVG